MKKNFKRIKKQLFGFFLLTVVFGACKKFVEVVPPVNQIVTQQVFDNSASATAALLNIYNDMGNNSGVPFTISNWNGLSADELINYSGTVQGADYYINAMNTNDISTGNGPWYYGYTYIYQTNAIIQGLQNANGISSVVKQQLTGEALFMRAFWHFYLATTYGDVPLALTTDYTVTSKLSRTPRLQVYRQCINDLSQAYSMVNTNYVDVTDTITTTERVRPNKAAVAALLARIYLYMGDYDNHNTADYANAEQQATTVIKNSNYNLSSLSGVFLKNSSEAILQLQIASNSRAGATSDGYFYILTGAPNAFTGSPLSSQLFNAFETGDNRKTQWIGSYTSGTTTWNYPFKYKNKGTGTVTEYEMVLRLGEQYLIRSEARAEQGNISGALSDLNVIRNRAGLPNYAGAQDQASILAAILHERQVELFTEWGNRWFDLIRATNTSNPVNVNTVMSVVIPQKGGVWNPNDYQTLWPIPLTEIEKDPNLTQNPGY